MIVYRNRAEMMTLGYSLTLQMLPMVLWGCEHVEGSIFKRLSALRDSHAQTPSYTAHLKHVRWADCQLVVRICWYYHHCDYFDLRWVLWNSSGSFSHFWRYRFSPFEPARLVCTSYTAPKVRRATTRAKTMIRTFV